MERWRWLVWLASAAAACSGGGALAPQARDGALDGGRSDGAVNGGTSAQATLPAPSVPVIVGEVRVPPAARGSTRATRASALGTASSDGNDIAPGVLIVGGAPGAGDVVAALAATPGLQGYRFRRRAEIGPRLLTIEVTTSDGRALSRDETRQLARRLTSHPALRLVDVDRIQHRHRVPDDPLFVQTWAPRHANLAGAWDLVTGSPEVVVAVLDDGVKPHPDLADKLLPGWDMIADPATAMDGDGRDPDPSPVAHTEKNGSSTWHGEHVAGIIAAVADNGLGLAGAAPGCRLLPVRVLGREGASVTSDTIAGMYWAAGLEVPGVPTNQHPAQVINLSLGGTGTSAAEQQAVSDVVAQGVVVVAAAGNDAHEVRGTSWGSYQGVLTVGAVDRQGRRAYYSNRGPEVAVMAPGGDMETDLDGDGVLDGILSTWFDENGNQPTYELQQGTSMAAPLVSGIVALVKTAAPALSPAEVADVLRSTAIPAPGCSDGCGAGLVDAAAAVMRARGLDDFSQPPALEPGFERLHLDQAGGGAAIFNAGGGALVWTMSFAGEAAAALTAIPSSGTIPAKSGTTIRIALTATPASGVGHAVLDIASNGGNRSVPVTLAVAGATPDVGPLWVYLYDGDANGRQGGRSPVFSSTGYTFVVQAQPGQWYLGAGLDSNGDGVLGPGDWWALYPSIHSRQPIQVDAAAEVRGPFELTLEPFR